MQSLDRTDHQGGLSSGRNFHTESKSLIRKGGLSETMGKSWCYLKYDVLGLSITAIGPK